MKRPLALLLMGPTASGKTALALSLARALPVELVSVDSAQVFRDMNVGTAKPDAATLAAFPHHLIDLISPEEAYSAARFCADAERLIAEIAARGRVPLLVGGTMLYFKALIEGLAKLPPACAQTRAQIDAEAAAHGWPALHRALAEVDPVSAARLAPNDSQRIQRALEVFRLSGRPLAALIAAGRQEPSACDFFALGLLPSARSVLHERIALRFDAMLAAGLEDELTMLRSRYRLHLDLPSMRCVGYRQVYETQEGISPRGEMRERGIYATRQLAKRQITWLANTLKSEVFDCLDAGLQAKVYERVARVLDEHAGT